MKGHHPAVMRSSTVAWFHALHEAFDSATRILQTYAGQRLDRAPQDVS